MLRSRVGDVHAVPVSHGEGRFVSDGETLSALTAAGQVATQYTDATGAPSMDISVNPNGSLAAIEGLFSPDGRVFGKMGHTERRGALVAKNIHGDKHQPVFESGVLYYK
jgi:phosphoribosylformylglycinamidine synthase